MPLHTMSACSTGYVLAEESGPRICKTFRHSMMKLSDKCRFVSIGYVLAEALTAQEIVKYFDTRVIGPVDARGHDALRVREHVPAWCRFPRGGGAARPPRSLWART